MQCSFYSYAFDVLDGGKRLQMKRGFHVPYIMVLLLFIGHLLHYSVARIPDEPAMTNIMMTTPLQVSTIAPIDTGQGNVCFYAEEDLCLQTRENEICRECMPHPTVPNSLVCCNVTDIERAISCVQNLSPDNSTYWSNVHIRNATLEELDISQKFLKRLTSLTVTDGQINRVVNEFSKFSTPKCVNISNNNISVINARAFKELRLQMLDLSYNNLSMIPNLNSATNLTLDIQGNTGLLCKSVLESIDRGGVHFLDLDSTSCLTNHTFNWFMSTDSIPLRQLVRMKQLQSECPYIPGHGNCTCQAERMTFKQQSDGSQWEFAAKVDCSNLGLLELPPTLPPLTLTLNVTNNNISSLAALSDNPSYQNILRVYADDNQINSILELEGTKFIQEFDFLYLRRNKIKTIPIYMLSNTLDNSPDTRILHLGGNYLHCDCNSAKVLKLWLLARQNHIPDGEKIHCENLAQDVVDLSETKLCQSPHDWTDYIYLLIAGEIVLLIAIFTKVSYDYYVFKTAGYLPWPASRMPKLPCDWLCES